MCAFFIVIGENDAGVGATMRWELLAAQMGEKVVRGGV